MSVVNRMEYIIKHNRFIQVVFKSTLSLFFRFIGLFVKIDKKLVLITGLKAGVNDSSKALFDYMIEHHMENQYKIVWAVSHPNEFNVEKVRFIKIDTFKYFITALKAKYWIACVNIERSLNFKKKKTIFLNTWHGVPLKNIGNSVLGRKDYNFSKIDYFCVSSDLEIDIYKKSFNMQTSQMIMTGLPRNDYLYKNIHNDAEKQRILEKLSLPKNKKIILYAPTWRESTDNGKTFGIKPPIDFELLEKRLKNDYIILMRAHHYTTDILGIKFNNFVYDFSSYSNVNELMIISDCLISDYSSITVDFCILEKPFFLFAYDLNEYKKERGFALDFETIFKEQIVLTSEQLISKITNIGPSNFENSKKVKEEFHKYGGNATKECILRVFK